MPQLFSFIETDMFRKKLDSLSSIETLFAIQNDLVRNPKRGAVIPGTKGVRKARIADPRSSKGKSGSFRYLYLLIGNAGVIYLIYFFSKSEKTNISQNDKKEISELVEHLKAIYRRN